MDILRILAVLGRGDQTSSEGMYEVLVDVMRRADTGINVGYAIGETSSLYLHVCIMCILTCVCY